jgi:hypothetical protein
MPCPPRETLLSASELSDCPDDIESLSVGVITYVTGCQYSRGPCEKQARIKVRASDHSGVLIWHRVFCHEHAGRVLDEAPALGYWIIDD